MGPKSDPMAVVDARLRVKGIDCLRVADASIMPTVVGGNTNAPAIMIGERAADRFARMPKAPRMPPESMAGAFSDGVDIDRSTR